MELKDEGPESTVEEKDRKADLARQIVQGTFNQGSIEERLQSKFGSLVPPSVIQESARAGREKYEDAKITKFVDITAYRHAESLVLAYANERSGNGST